MFSIAFNGETPDPELQVIATSPDLGNSPCPPWLKLTGSKVKAFNPPILPLDVVTSVEFISIEGAVFGDLRITVISEAKNGLLYTCV